MWSRDSGSKQYSHRPQKLLVINVCLIVWSVTREARGQTFARADASFRYYESIGPIIILFLSVSHEGVNPCLPFHADVKRIQTITACYITDCSSYSSSLIHPLPLT